MASSHPLVAAILYPGDDDPRYQLYCQAYGIEMQIDSDWPAELVLLTPPEYLTAITEDTDVTGEEAAIVSAGVTDLRRGADGQPDSSVISHSRNNWLLLGHPSVTDSRDDIDLKIDLGLQAGARLIVCLTNTSESHISSRLSICSAIGEGRLVVAFVPPVHFTREEAAAAAASVKLSLSSMGINGARVLVAVPQNANIACETLSATGVDGVLLEGRSHDIFCEVLEVLRSLGR